MAQYKVLQDIEAEDKLIGPLTFRQCVYAAIAVFCYWLCFLVLTKHVGFMLVIFLPPALFTTFFAVPWQTQQTTEVWALAKIRFFFKPRRRIWDQSGVKELVTITAPKKVEINYTDGLSQTEVKSRLHALADTIDSRGWAVKNITANIYNQPMITGLNSNSDRLVTIDSLPQVSGFDATPEEDILDTQNNPVARQFDQMINASKEAQRQHIRATMQQPAGVATATSASPQTPTNYWFTNPSGTATTAAPSASQVLPPVAVQPTVDEQTFVEQRIQAKEAADAMASAHMHAIQPLGSQAAPQQPLTPPAAPVANNTTDSPVTPPVDPAILELANNNDLNVATIAREAHKHLQEPPDEVVISLH